MTSMNHIICTQRSVRAVCRRSIVRCAEFNFNISRRNLNLYSVVPTILTPFLAVMPEMDVVALGIRTIDAFSTEATEQVIAAVAERPSVLEQFTYLSQLRTSKPGLFFATLQQRPAELLPIVYTPGIGEACLNWGLLPSKPKGLILSQTDSGQLVKKLKDFRLGDTKVVVVTDGQRILGLGDLGANGVGISVGKALMYSLAAGLYPESVVPVALDVGCDNSQFLSSSAYIGAQKPRLQGEQYDSFVEEFHKACQVAYGKSVVIHWEDFGIANAVKHLNKFRQKGPTFNDDIQSTAAVALGCILGATRRTGVPPLTSQLFLLAGAGQASLGIASLLVTALVAQGLTRDEAYGRIWMFDRKGLLGEGREGLDGGKLEFVQTKDAMSSRNCTSGASIGECIRKLKPTCLIGATGKSGVFTQQVLTDMYDCMPIIEAGEASTAPFPDFKQELDSGGSGPQFRSRTVDGTYAMPASGVESRMKYTPIVMPLSNPTSCSECTLQEALDACDGNVMFASGSPFPPASINDVAVQASQANNVMVFPGVGAGSIFAVATEIPESAFLQAGYALAEELTEDEVIAGLCIPPVVRIRDAALAVATAVCIECIRSGNAAISSGRVFRLATASLESQTSGNTKGAIDAFVSLRSVIDEWRY